MNPASSAQRITSCCCSYEQNTIMHGAPFSLFFGSGFISRLQNQKYSLIRKYPSEVKNELFALSLSPFRLSPSMYH